ncbi:MAG: preprotein translocase subunit YajC [Actinomycetota bacterium]|jgi:preprotein translocase subunit YajC
MDSIGSFLPLILIVAVFYLLVIRPSQNRKKKMAELISNVGPGTDVMTSSGIFGTVISTTPEQIELSIAPGVVIRILPAAISRVITPVVDAPAE